MDMVPSQLIFNSLIFSLIGLALFVAAFLFFDRITPGNFWKEILEEHNVALAVVVGAVTLGISLIVASAIHG